MLYYNKYKWLGVFFMQKDEYCNWFMTNQATDGTKGYKIVCYEKTDTYEKDMIKIKKALDKVVELAQL